MQRANTKEINKSKHERERNSSARSSLRSGSRSVYNDLYRYVNVDAKMTIQQKRGNKIVHASTKSTPMLSSMVGNLQLTFNAKYQAKKQDENAFLKLLV